MSRSRSRRPGKARPARRPLRHPARQGLVRRRGVPRPDENPGHGVPGPERLCGGVRRTQVDPRPGTGASREGTCYRQRRLHRLGLARSSNTTATMSSGSTPATTRAATSAATLGARRGSHGRARRQPTHLEGFDAVVHLAALSNDPLGDLSRELTYEINHRGDAARRTRGEEAGCRASSSRPPARCTAPPTRTSCSPRMRRSARSLPMRSRRCAPRRPCASSTATGSRPSRCGTRRSTACRLGCGWTSCSTTSPAWSHMTGRIRLLSDGTSWRPLLHVRDLAKSRSAWSTRQRSSSRGKAFNIGSDAQNYLVRDLAEVLAEVTGCEVEFAGDAVARPALVPRRLLGAGTGLSRPRARLGRHGAAPRSSSTPIAPSGSPTEAFEGRSYVRLRQLRHLLDEHRAR